MLYQAALTLSLFLFGQTQSEPVASWFIDTDAGSDDGVAINLALGLEALQKDFKIVGISAVQGNTNADNVGRNVLKILKTANRLDIPVYKGANQSLLITPPGDNFFGEDGFGDFPYPNPPSEDLIKEEHAVNALIRIVKESPGQINLLAIGPLTNIAMAIRMDPTFYENLAKLVILGGSVKGVGNVKPGVEFNIYIDPEAAFIVFAEAERLNKPLTMVPWEAALALEISMEWRKNKLGAIKSPIIELLNNAEGMSIKQEAFWVSSDTFAAAVALSSSIVFNDTLVSGVVENCGTFSRGATIIDTTGNPNDNNAQIRVVQPGSIDRDYIEELLLAVFSSFIPNNTKKVI